MTNIRKAPVSQLVRAVTETRKYAFLIGAGTSRPEPAAIKTAGELVEEWQKECFEREQSEESANWTDWVTGREPEDDWKDWAAYREANEELGTAEQYGFWFSARHPMRYQRRQAIAKLVEDAKPTPSHILLALLMSSGIEEDGGRRSGTARRYVPFTLTPNFDDLLFDAFYFFLEAKPRLINHRTLAPEFKLTGSRPTIVKLHGDYLYDNLKNTVQETESLERAMQRVLERTVDEYGLVVVGYSGGDESIMTTLCEADLSEYGLFWCVRNEDSLSDNARVLFERQPNAQLVEITGFETLMVDLMKGADGIELPRPEEVTERAEKRADILEAVVHERMNRARKSTKHETEWTFLRDWSERFTARQPRTADEYRARIEEATRTIEDGSADASTYVDLGAAMYGLAANHESDGHERLERYREAIEQFEKALRVDPTLARAHYKLANTKGEVGDELAKMGKHKQATSEYEGAIETFEKALKLDPEYAEAHVSLGYTKYRLGRYQEAKSHYDDALSVNPEYDQAFYLRGVAASRLGDYEAAVEDYDQALDWGLESAETYLHRAQTRILQGNFHLSRRDAQKAKDLSESSDKKALSALLSLVPAVVLAAEPFGGDVRDDEATYLTHCEREFTSTWDLDPLDSWLVQSGLTAAKEEKLRELIEALRAHEPESSPDTAPA